MLQAPQPALLQAPQPALLQAPQPAPEQAPPRRVRVRVRVLERVLGRDPDCMHAHSVNWHDLASHAQRSN